MFMLNLLFDFDEKKGSFSGDRTGPGRGVLFTSKNWLKLIADASHPEPGVPFPSTFNPETANWDNLDDIESGSLLIPKSASPDDSNVGVRIALDPDSTAAVPLGSGFTGAELTLAVCFGRPTQARQPFASPFADSTGAVQTTFVFADQKTNTTLGGSPVGWFFPLGMVVKRPSGPLAVGRHQTHRYEFSVGVKVKSGGVIRHYGQDPEMDIGQ